MDLTTIETRITEVEDAIHKLMTGAREVQVQHADGMVRYWLAASVLTASVTY